MQSCQNVLGNTAHDPSIEILRFRLFSTSILTMFWCWTVRYTKLTFLVLTGIILFFMADQIMLLQRRLVEVPLVAPKCQEYVYLPFELALKWVPAVYLLVYLQVLFQIRTRGKLFVAYFTLEWLLTGVNPLVPDQIANLGKGLSATRVVAFVGLLLVMHPSVLLQWRVLGKSLVANLTILLGTDFKFMRIQCRSIVSSIIKLTIWMACWENECAHAPLVPCGQRRSYHMMVLSNWKTLKL